MGRPWEGRLVGVLWEEVFFLGGGRLSGNYRMLFVMGEQSDDGMVV